MHDNNPEGNNMKINKHILTLAIFCIQSDNLLIDDCFFH